MEVCIRLQRAGKGARKKYNYRLVAISKKAPREGRHLEIIGYYDPSKEPMSLSINHEKLDKWVKTGAQMSDTVRSLVKQSKKTK